MRYRITAISLIAIVIATGVQVFWVSAASIIEADYDAWSQVEGAERQNAMGALLRAQAGPQQCNHHVYPGTMKVYGDRLLDNKRLPDIGAYEFVGNLPTPTPIPTPSGSLEVEAEDMALTLPMVIYENATASGGQYIQTTEGSSGMAVYVFNVAEAGEYKIEAKVMAPDIGTNSFYVAMDQDPQDPQDIWDVLYGGEQNSSWTWDEVTQRGNGTSDKPQYDPRVFNLSVGTHYLYIKGREAGTKLDWLRIVRIAPINTPTPTPTETLSPTPTPTVTSTPLPTYTPMPTFTSVPSPTNSPTPMNTPSPTATNTPTPLPTDTPIPTSTLTTSGTSTSGTSTSGTTYYVAPNGNDNDIGSLQAPWRTIGKANQTLQAGDIVILRGGTYRETIRPARSGLPGQPITYTNYNSEEAIITDVYDGVDLSNRSYIVLDGLKILSTGHYWVNMDPNATHNIIENCYMEEAGGWGGIYLRHGADWNQVLNNTLVAYMGPDDPIFCFDSSYNLFEGNNIAYGPHCSLNVQSRERATIKNVIRNNTIRNVWHHTVNVYENADYTLIEGNVLLDAGEDHTYNPGGDPFDRNMARPYHNGLQLGSSNCIVRYNIMINNGSGISMNSYNTPASRAFNNRIYHNTLFQNYIGIQTATDLPVYGNVLKNNIVFNNRSYEIYRYIGGTPKDNYYVYNDILGSSIRYDDDGIVSLSYLQNKYPQYFFGNVSGNPQFVNESGRDLHLKAGSPMIDAGVHISQAAGAGDGTSIKVKDARYFCDGFGVVEADWIRIGSGAPVQIQSVNYETNVITLKDTRSWASGDSVNLYKNSLGQEVLDGSAPDIGAFEYIGSLPTSTPTNTPTPTTTPNPTATSTPTPLPTATPIPTSTPTPTNTPSPTATSTPTPLPTDTPIPTNTAIPSLNTPTPTFTSAPSPTNTLTPTHTPAPTDTPLPTNTPTLAPTSTPTPTATNTLLPTYTPTPTDTPLPTHTPTLAPTNTPTLAPASTSTPIPTNTPRSTPTLMPTPTNTPRSTPTLIPSTT